jgi:hypothetical protein
VDGGRSKYPEGSISCAATASWDWHGYIAGFKWALARGYAFVF